MPPPLEVGLPPLPGGNCQRDFKEVTAELGPRSKQHRRPGYLFPWRMEAVHSKAGNFHLPLATTQQAQTGRLPKTTSVPISYGGKVRESGDSRGGKEF